MIKRILLVVALTIATFMGFSYLSKTKAEIPNHEDHENELDDKNIPLSEKQVKAIDLKMGEAQELNMDAMLTANGL